MTAERSLSVPQEGVTARLRREAERLRTENEVLRTTLRQVRGHVITREARRVIDAVLATRRG